MEKADREAIVRALKAHLKDELDVEIGGLEAEFLLDFMAERLGPHFYNDGLRDARAALAKRVELIDEDIEMLERPVIR